MGTEAKIKKTEVKKGGFKATSPKSQFRQFLNRNRTQ
jgi:hypothetical protein